MPLLVRRPAATLAPFVDVLWASSRGACAHARELNLPTGCADLVVPLGPRAAPAVLIGAHDRATSRDTSQPSTVVGVHFRPGGLAAFLDAPAGEFTNRRLALEDIWGRSATELGEQLAELDAPAARLEQLERLLEARLVRREIDPLVRFALARFRASGGGASVGAVQRASGVPAERFIERFRDAVGLAPKRYLRVARLRGLLERVAARGSANWGELAFEFGFSDQAHLVREFRDLTGLTPGAYQPVASRQPMHVAIGAGAEKPSRRGSRAGLRSP